MDGMSDGRVATICRHRSRFLNDSVIFRAEIHIAFSSLRGCILRVLYSSLFYSVDSPKWKTDRRRTNGRYRNRREAGVLDVSIVRAWFRNALPRAKDAAGGEKKNNVSENWTELVKILSGCVEATQAKRSNYRFHSRYTFSKRVSPPGIKFRNLFLMVYRVVSWFLSRRSTSYPAPIPSEIERACASFISCGINCPLLSCITHMCA